MSDATSFQTDAIGRVHTPAGDGARIVCLVPSITELLFSLGVGGMVVGRTGFCVHPKPQVKKVLKVGGTKDFDLERIRALAPTHLIVNVDENPKQRVDAAAVFVPNVIVTHPMGPLDNPPLYRLLGGMFGAQPQAECLAAEFDSAYREAAAATQALPRERVLYLIWKNPWMTISRDTYIARTLAAVGWEQIDAGGGERYPTVDLDAVLGRVDRVLLSSEPYAFRARDVKAMQEKIDSLTPAGGTRNAQVSLIDAEMTSWYGSRAVEGMRYLQILRRDGVSRA
ncbi:MAG TPA: helical backbone metal receptor [Burkholderiales bacterium]|nr:helical backbone metal receptor [Burkholderiales bacterium]